MAEFRVSLEELLEWCHVAEKMEIPQRMLFFESEESGWIHSVPRLLVLLEGKSNIRYRENGMERNCVIQAPAFFYCARTGYFLRDASATIPSRTLSFSFYPTYIRAMMIDEDGITPPPTAQDIYYHSTEPLGTPGTKLLEVLDALHEANEDDIALKLLPMLFQLAIHDLEASSAAPILKVRRLWDEINTYLREHRNESITRRDVGRLFRISPGYVSELCRKYADDTFSNLKMRYQLEHARILLEHTRLSLEEIAGQSGFSGANYFIRRFKRAFGTTPHVFRNHTPEK